jgi:hypothetical protein
MNLFIAFGITRSRHKNLRRLLATLNVIFNNWYYLLRLVLAIKEHLHNY